MRHRVLLEAASCVICGLVAAALAWAADRGEPAARDTHWAFVPPIASAPPDVATIDWPRSDMDRFILSKLEAAGIAPARDAGPRTLLRRVCFDLIGLPPSPGEVDAFAADPSPARFAEVVDRLLASPQFGERWGRHWLDIVRFAESSGREFNFTYPHAWPYRDYVIDAFNTDKPFDQFLIEQIAGDLLPKDEASYDNELAVATGFLAIGPKRHNTGGAEFRWEIVDDQIDVTCKAVLALTAACAKCHDHKFDPIPTHDYYALAGIFRSTKPLYGTIQQTYSNHPTQAIPFGPNANAKHAAAEAHEKKISAAKAQLAEAQKTLASLEPAVESSNDGQDDQKRDKPPDAARAAVAENVRGLPPTPPGGPLVDELNGTITRLTAEIAALEKGRPPRPHYTCAVADEEKPAHVKIALNGDFRKPGDEVPRGFLTAVSTHEPPAIAGGESGRAALAAWLASRDNPLTARVFVNRIWQHLLGRGIVASVDNFGTLGKPPTHPELLDTLAVQFMENGWSIKRLIRRIVLSRTYQLSGDANEAAIAVDADNTLLWRASTRRLEAEAIRDALLAVSGQLDLTRPVGSPVTGLGDQLVRAIDLKKLVPESNHRSVYLPVIRDYPPEVFELFDFPSPDMVSGLRAVTTVPVQELFFQNSPFVAGQARHAARRVLSVEGLDHDVERVDYAFRLALARPPSEAERDASLAFLVRSIQVTAENNSDLSVAEARETAWAGMMHALLAGAEFRYLMDAD